MIKPNSYISRLTSGSEKITELTIIFYDVTDSSRRASRSSSKFLSAYSLRYPERLSRYCPTDPCQPESHGKLATKSKGKTDR